MRVRLNPAALCSAAGLSSQDVYTAIRAANVNGPVGGFQGPLRAETIELNGQITEASDYAGAGAEDRNGATVRLGDVAEVLDSVSNTKLAAWRGTQPAILLTLTKTAGANVIDTVDRVRAALPQLMAWIPPDIRLVHDLRPHHDHPRQRRRRASWTLLISIALVLMVVALFMRRLVPTLAAAVTVPLSLAGTLGAMYLLGYSLNNFSLMALTISVGLRGGRRDRHDREHLPPPGARVVADAGGACGIAADRLHRDVDQHLADRGVHPDPVHGRPVGQAVP